MSTSELSSTVCSGIFFFLFFDLHTLYKLLAVGKASYRELNLTASGIIYCHF